VRAGFSLPLDIVVAPGRAFLKIAKTCEWVPAMIVIAALGMLTAYLALPAVIHIETVATVATVPPPKLSAAQIRSEVMLELGYQALFVPLLVAALTATTLTVVARFKDPTAPYSRFFSLAANCLVPSALGGLIGILPVAVRGAGAYPDLRSLALAIPDNLAVFGVPGNERELEFLSHFDIFSGWSAVLLAFGFSAFAGIRFAWALVIALSLDLAFSFMF
jgi:Yip1 domain